MLEHDGHRLVVHRVALTAGTALARRAAFGIAFQMPVALSLMAKVGIVSSKGLRGARRYAIVGIFVFAAIVTPPDPMSQIGLAIPLIGLYELSIFAAKLVEPKPVEEDDA